jgi:hypothetical protein
MKKSLEWASPILQLAHVQIGEDGQLVNGGEWATTFQFYQIIDRTNLHDQLKEHYYTTHSCC